MIELIIYLVLAVATFKGGYILFYDGKDSYTTDNEFLFFWICAALLWPPTLAGLALWRIFALLRPTTPGEKRREREAALQAAEKDLLRRQVEHADLEHENGYKPIDPPADWVPKGSGWARGDLERRIS